MKKAFTLFACIVFFLSFLLFGHIMTNNVAYAEESESDAEETIEKSLTEALDGIDLHELDAFLAELTDLGTTLTAKELLNKILHNDSSFDFKFFLDLLLGYFIGDTKSFVTQMLLILGICIILSLLHNLSSGFAKSSTQKIVYLVCYCVIIAIVSSMIASVVFSITNLLKTVTKFCDIVFPVLLLLINAIGASATATIYQPIFLIFSQILLKIVSYIILPLFYGSFVFTLLGHMVDDLKLDKAASFLRSVGNWILGSVFGIFITFTTAQGITGASVDSLASRGLKYVLSGYVPVIGGYLKDGFDILTASFIVIKNGLGLVFVIILFIVFIPIIVKTAAASLSLRLSAALSEPFSDKKIPSMLGGVSKTLLLPTLAVVCVLFSLCILFMLIILTCNRGLV